MAGVTELHWEAVPEPVIGLLRDLSGTLQRADFYLAGGTALALQLGHRISEDLGLFSATFDDPESVFSSLRSTSTATGRSTRAMTPAM